jgi:hypothetical protein
MSAEGRTYWWCKDSAWYRRELIVILGMEFGAAGPAVIDWLSCEAKSQNDAGRVKSGPTAIAHGAFVDLVTVGHVLSRAVELKLLDDFEERDGRFTCRVSGFQADQDRGRAALRQAVRRERGRSDSPAPADNPDDEPSVTSGDESRPVTDGHAESPTGQDRTEEKASPSREIDPDVQRLSHLLAVLIRERDPKAGVKPDSDRWLTAMRLLLKDRGGDIAEVERIIRWSQADSFWQANILSPTNLREKFDQLYARAAGGGRPNPNPGRDERRGRGVQALRSMIDAQPDDDGKTRAA